MELNSYLKSLTSLKVKHTHEEGKAYLTCLLMGYSGSGKTHMAGTFPSPLIIDLDKGLSTLLDKQIPYITIDGEVYDEKKKEYRPTRVYYILVELIRVFRERAKLSAEESKQIFGVDIRECKTLIIDSFMALNEMMLREVMKYPERKDKYGKPVLSRDINKEKPEWDDYSAVKRRSLHIMNLLKDVKELGGANVVVTCGIGEKDIRDGRGVVLSQVTQPLIEGSFRDLIGYGFDEVYLLEEKKGKYIVKTRGAKIKTKSRKSLDDVIEDPSYEKLIG